MPRTKLLVSALMLALAGTSVAQAQSFSDVVVFGDSLSDAGNAATADGNPFTLPGSSFTTNPDQVYAQIVAQAFGFSGDNSLAGGSNYAYGGACARANSVSFTCVNSPGSWSLPSQMTTYLSLPAHAGHADPNALYMMWGGANDIFTAVLNPATAQLNTGIAAATMVGLIGNLQTAGARTIVVFNLPDLGLTPANFGTGNQAGASGLSFVYNQTFNAGLANLGDGIVPVNVNLLINEIVANPSLYGFTDVTHAACNGSSVACGPTGDVNYPYHYANGTNATYLFADSVHPTGAAHAMLANIVLATLAAPGEVSMAGEVPLQVYEDHTSVINRQIFRAGIRDNNEANVYANVQFSQQDFKANANVGATNNDLFTATFGSDVRFNEHFSFGAALSFGNSNGDVGHSSVDNKEVLVSGYGAAHFGRGYANIILSGGSANLDIDRAIVLGPTTRIETGSTSASHTGAELGAGFAFGGESFRHGPFVGLSWQNVEVSGYSEDGNDGTAMYFGDFKRKSTVRRFGYRFEGDMGGFRPYGRIAWAKDSQDRQVTVQAGSKTMNGHFTLDGYPGAEDWIEADLGLGYDVSDKSTVSVSYRSRLSDDTQDLKSFNLGFEMKF